MENASGANALLEAYAKLDNILSKELIPVAQVLTATLVVHTLISLNNDKLKERLIDMYQPLYIKMQKVLHVKNRLTADMSIDVIVYNIYGDLGLDIFNKLSYIYKDIYSYDFFMELVKSINKQIELDLNNFYEEDSQEY